MGIKAIDLRRGMAVNMKNGIWIVQDNQKVAKGNWRSYQVIQLKNLSTGQLIEDRFRIDEQFDQAIMERRDMEYLFSEGTTHVLMDPATYDQVPVPAELIGDAKVYLTPNIPVSMTFVDGKPVMAELPNTVELVVVDTPPEVKGATATNVMKEAQCQGGAKVKVPAFITIGTTIKVDTRTGEYLGRAQ